MESKLNRRTFAIISHPDAGKTTVTEKILWFGQVIREMGMVKSKKGAFAKSDWMEMEKERGISITSSVMSFDFYDKKVHLLDTPGHKDFSEDTYRTLTAVESVLMMIDSAKGVEAQTIKLMQVCRLRDTPIVTFMNKYDREALDPFELIDNVEKICSIQCCPMTWPIGSGVDFKGVLDLTTRKIRTFGDDHDPFSPSVLDASDLDSPELVAFVGEDNIAKLKEELEMVEEVLPKFSKEEFLAGIQTPVFFGSALHNFGVREVLETIVNEAPGPTAKEALTDPSNIQGETRKVSPLEEKFTGFIFKIQANMDPKHRDRIGFLRVCSGTFKRGEKLHHVRTGKDLKITAPMIFQSQDRDILDQAWPGDIVGLPGSFQIGDTLTNGEKIQFTGIPRFAPELFRKAILKDPLKAKHLDKGLRQLSEEGAVQLFTKLNGNDKILGAVGALQFDVVQYRLEHEYNVRGVYESLGYQGICWILFPNKKIENDFTSYYPNSILFDRLENPCFAYNASWDLKMAKEKFPDVNFYKNSDYKEGQD
jgi:peptide chain release factor 3